jgi:predicted transcriptional regulator of viral defense system
MAARATKREAIRSHLRREGRASLSLANDALWLGKITPNPARLLADMAQKGYAHRLQAGRYLVELEGESPQELPLVEALEPLAGTLLDKLRVPYFLSWHTALYHFGLLEQQATTIFCGIPKQKDPVRFSGFEVRFVKVGRDSFFGIEPAKGLEQQVVMANIEKALLDSLSRPDLVAPFPVVIGAFDAAIDRALLDAEKLVAYTIQLDSAALARRVGFLMDRYGLAGSEPLLRHIGPTRRIEAFRPGDDRRRGNVDAKWRLRVPARILATAENPK